MPTFWPHIMGIFYIQESCFLVKYMPYIHTIRFLLTIFRLRFFVDFVFLQEALPCGLPTQREEVQGEVRELAQVLQEDEGREAR